MASRSRRTDAAGPIVGTQDDGAGYGATFDAAEHLGADVHWNANPTASLVLKPDLPVAAFDSIFPCAPTPATASAAGDHGPDQYLDILSYRQRPTLRLAYRNFGTTSRS